MRNRIAIVVGAVVLASGCAGIPQSGPVHVGAAPLAAPAGETDVVPVLPPGPRRDASPVQIVSGFLAAMVDSDARYGVAREFLAPGTAWVNSTAAITTYSDPPKVVRTSPTTVTVTAPRVGTVSARGSYRVEAGTLHRTFTVARRAGQWRISRLSPGVLLSTDGVERSLQPVSVYYLNSSGDRLVPDPLLVPPQQSGLATTLINDLLSGPSRHLAPGVTTAVPQGTTLVGTVPVTAGGVAEVNLSAEARDLSPIQLERLSAQIVWTLRQLSSVTAVRLSADNSPLTSADVPRVQPVRSWPQYDPAAPPVAAGALFVRSGVPDAIGTVVPSSLAGRHVTSPARSADGTTVAALRRDGRQLVVGGTAGPLRVRLSAARVSAPAFDPAGDVFVATTGVLGDRLLEVPPNAHPRAVALPEQLAGRPLDRVSLSRDGARIAMLVGPLRDPELVVGTISSQPGHLSVEDVATVIPAGSRLRGLAWLNASEIVTTERSGPGHRAVMEVSVDGYQVQSVVTAGAPPAPREVAAAPGQRLLISAADGVWVLSGNRWVRRSGGHDPSYAG